MSETARFELGHQAEGIILSFIITYSHSIHHVSKKKSSFILPLGEKFSFIEGKDHVNSFQRALSGQNMRYSYEKRSKLQKN